MTRDDIDTLWNQAIDQSIAAGEKFTRYSFVGLLKRQMIRDGWRQCAEGQRTTQFCALTEEAVKAEREECAKLCDDLGDGFPLGSDELHITKSLARDIRARK